MSETIDFGIDLGTTNSAIAKFVDGKVEIFKDPTTWKDTLSSVVGFRKGRILTGNAARIYLEKDPGNVISEFKRKMGTSEVFEIESLGQSLSSVELSAHILRALKTHIPTGESIESAVITVPASFDIIQSNATIEAGKLAGLSQVLLLQEPIAASLAYANLAKEELGEGTWLVYDLGGGTFDVALVSIVDGELRVIDDEGDNFLGGADFDRLIVEYFVIPKICEEFEIVDLASDFQSASGKYNQEFYSILKKAEEAKIALTHSEMTELIFDFQDEEVVVEITRQQFEEVIDAEVGRSIKLIEKVLKRNADITSEIDFILLVGGSTFIPYVRKTVSERLKLPTRFDIDPTTAIAVGAAFYAGMKEREVSNGKPLVDPKTISVKSAYKPVTRETEEYFAARITGEISDCFYKIVRDDGGFDTGLKKLHERIDEDLPLVADSLNDFSFMVFDSHQNRVESDISAIQILQSNRHVDVIGQPVTKNIYIELDDIGSGTTYLHKIFEKGTILPATSNPIPLIANRIIRANDDSDRLAINVYQGDCEDFPEANHRIAQVLIPGSEFEDDLVKGSSVNLELSMTESQELTVSTYLDELDYECEKEFLLGTRTVVVGELQTDLANLRMRSKKELNKAKDGLDEGLIRELQGVYHEIDQLEDQSLELSEDDGTDQKLKYDSKMRELAGDLHEAIAKRLGERLIAEYLGWKTKCELAIEPLRDAKFEGFLSGITQNESRYLDPPVTETLKSRIEELEAFYWSVMWKTPSYITDRFNSLIDREEDVANQGAFQDLIENGQIALIDEDYDKLREITFRMYDFLPTSEREHRGKTGLSR